MSLFKRIPARDLPAHFTHRGWFLGLVPVYLADVRTDSPRVETRNWVPDLALEVAAWLFEAFCWSCDVLGLPIDTSFPMLITGRIDGTRIADTSGALR